jgi:hypothetical protein
LLEEKLELQRNEPVPVPDQETLAAIEDTNKKLDLIEGSPAAQFIFSQKVINAILEKKMPSIKITGIAYENSFNEELGQEQEVSIRGFAPSREALLLFREALEDSPNFKSVDLPISNFVRGANIQFYLTLTPS